MNDMWLIIMRPVRLNISADGTSPEPTIKPGSKIPVDYETFRSIMKILDDTPADKVFRFGNMNNSSKPSCKPARDIVPSLPPCLTLQEYIMWGIWTGPTMKW